MTRLPMYSPKRNRTLLPPTPDRRIVTGITPDELPRAKVADRFRQHVEAGARLKPAGTARHDPEVLLSRRYLPRHTVQLFDATLEPDDPIGSVGVALQE